MRSRSSVCSFSQKEIFTVRYFGWPLGTCCSTSGLLYLLILCSFLDFWLINQDWRILTIWNVNWREILITVVPDESLFLASRDPQGERITSKDFHFPVYKPWGPHGALQ